MPNRKPIISDNGNINVKRIGLPNHYITDLYHHLMRINWPTFFLLFIIAYLCLNSLFASLYFVTGDNITNANIQSYWDSWIFSFQTSTTLGYGYMLPKTTLANIIVIFDALSGLLFVAITTGLAFTKLSRPTARVMFSNHVTITNYQETPTLMFRLANRRANEIIDANIRMVVLKNELTSEGIKMRRLLDIQLSRYNSPLFALTWTVMHKIDQHSPLYHLKEEDYLQQDINFIISFTGIDSVFSQTIHGRKIYSAEKIIFNKQFEDILIVDKNGDQILDYHKFHLFK